MLMTQVNLLFAFSAGLISFLSPCVFPLIPAYVAHLTGSLVKDNRVQARKGLLLIRSISFIFGFSLVFVLMGASASFIGQLFAAHRDVVEKISGLFIIIFGLQMTGIFQLRFLMMGKRWDSKTQPKGLGGSFLLGLAFGTGWTPCVGLALSSILLIAGTAATMYKGMLLLWVYSMGLGIPFF
jgi:cytochrome c-type biogenesis protein